MKPNQFYPVNVNALSSYKDELPTISQVLLANKIAKRLEIDFPSSSLDYTKEIYSRFIDANLDEYESVVSKSIPGYPDDGLPWYDGLN